MNREKLASKLHEEALGGGGKVSLATMAEALIPVKNLRDVAREHGVSPKGGYRLERAPAKILAPLLCEPHLSDVLDDVCELLAEHMTLNIAEKKNAKKKADAAKTRAPAYLESVLKLTTQELELAKGEVTPLPVPRSARSFMTLAQVTLRDTAMVVMSTRFVLPYCEPDLWRVGAWRSAREVHAVRVEQMDAVVARLAQEQDAPIILGGDFNTPVGDSLYRKLRPKFHDAFREAGVGFGNTIINDIPLSRIDQIWLTDHFAATATVARKTEHSDHRMVITDLAAASPP